MSPEPRPYDTVYHITTLNAYYTLDQMGRYRPYHCCYRCGHYEEDFEVLDQHEDQCHGVRPPTVITP